MFDQLTTEVLSRLHAHAHDAAHSAHLAWVDLREATGNPGNAALELADATCEFAKLVNQEWVKRETATDPAGCR
jgi:hypothetical protein